MAAEIDEITESNQPDIHSQIAHILTDLHDALNILHRLGNLTAKHDALLEEFRPLLEQFRSPLAARMTRRGRNGNG